MFKEMKDSIPIRLRDNYNEVIQYYERHFSSSSCLHVRPFWKYLTHLVRVHIINRRVHAALKIWILRFRVFTHL